jgi:hypothetical protein
VFARSEPPYRLNVCSVHCEMKTTQSFDGYDSPTAQMFGGFCKRIFE